MLDVVIRETVLVLLSFLLLYVIVDIVTSRNSSNNDVDSEDQ